MMMRLVRTYRNTRMFALMLSSGVRMGGVISRRRSIVEFRWDTQNTQTIPFRK